MTKLSLSIIGLFLFNFMLMLNSLAQVNNVELDQDFKVGDAVSFFDPDFDQENRVMGLITKIFQETIDGKTQKVIQVLHARFFINYNITSKVLPNLRKSTTSKNYFTELFKILERRKLNLPLRANHFDFVPNKFRIPARYFVEENFNTPLQLEGWPLIPEIENPEKICDTNVKLINDTTPLGPRSELMHLEFNKKHFPTLSHDFKTIKLNKKDYLVLTRQVSEFTKKPIAYLGSMPTLREVIILDPQSPKMIELKNELYDVLKTLPKENGVIAYQVAFPKVVEFLRAKLFNPDFPPSKLEAKTDQFIENWEHTEKGQHAKGFVDLAGELTQDVIPLEEFIEHKLGICRHHALALCFLVDSMIQDKLIDQGKIRLTRDNVPTANNRMGGHSWTTFVSSDFSSIWHIDSLWNLVLDLKQIQNRLYLNQQYSKEAITKIIRDLGKNL
jgi:hypothetical protein